MPSKRSWLERTRLGGRCQRGRGGDDALADHRVAAHELPLVVVERARLVQDRVGDRGLADVVELGRERDQLDLVLGEPEPLGGPLGQPGHAAEVLAQLDAPFAENLEQDVGALAAGRGPAGLVLVHALVGEAQCIGRRERLRRDQRHAV